MSKTRSSGDPSWELAEVDIDGIHFRPLLRQEPHRHGTQVVMEHRVEFSVPWQGSRQDSLLVRSGPTSPDRAEEEAREEARSRGEYRWHLQCHRKFLGTDRWLTVSQEPYGWDRGRSFSSSDAGLRWLFMCANFYRLRIHPGANSVSEFLSKIEELANRKEPFHSAHSFDILCGFVPEECGAWQVYRETRKTPRFAKVFEGSESSARKFLAYLDDGNDCKLGTALLLDPRNVITKANIYAP